MSETRLKVSRIIGQAVGKASQRAGFGSGAVLPGRVGLALEPNLFELARQKMKRGCIFVTGTNGKSTTTYYLSELLRSLNYTYCTNHTGANMLSGLASVCLNLKDDVDYGVFEVDEATLPKATELLRPTHVIVLNFSRDQMDRYTEIEKVIGMIRQAITKARPTLIYNAGNLYASILGQQYPRSLGYLTNHPHPYQPLDRPICWSCKAGLLSYEDGLVCSSCNVPSRQPVTTSTYRHGLLRILNRAIGCPSLELAETLTATALICKELGISEDKVIQGLERTPPLPAHEFNFRLNSQTTIDLILAKNPESFHRQLRKPRAEYYSQVIFAINNNYADGLDTSWLWDINFEDLPLIPAPILVSGLAADDLRLRLAVAGYQAKKVRSESLTPLLTGEKRHSLVIANYTAYKDIEHRLNSLATTSATQKQALEYA